ncbi:MAG TPA: Hsp20/alpha crystallin family protein [Cellvibrionaceae bacterium]
MSLIPRSTLNEIEHLFDHAWLPFRNEGGRFGTLAPRVDLKEKDDSFEITMELPGVKKENLTITLQSGVLRIEAESKQETVEQNDKILRQERQYGKYVRSFELGPQVQDSDISASFEHGILTLIAPKHREPQPSTRRIEVK